MSNFELDRILLIGASTGGPGEIEKIIKALPLLQRTAVVIAQHMPVEFIPSFRGRLSGFTKNQLSLVDDEVALKSSTIYICNKTVAIKRGSFNYIFSPVSQNAHIRYNPDIDTIFTSFVPLASQKNILCVILTGIGDDGVSGCVELVKNGAKALTQDKNSAIVDGMTSRARECVPNIEVCNTQTIIKKIEEFCS